MKKILLVFSAIFFLNGCVSNPSATYVEDAKVYMAENRPKALSGALSWSAYYAGVIVILEKIPLNVEGRNDEINSWRESLSMAKEYEAGRISKEDFYKWRQDANAKAEAKQSKNQKTRALCEYEAKAGAAGVQDIGRSGLNFDQMFKEKELFELCMKAKK